MTSKGCLKMKSIELAEIQATVARKFSITTDQMRSGNRDQTVIFACQIAMYIARMHTTKSLPEIAASFNKTHAAVLYGITTIKKRLEEEPSLASTVSGILEELEAIESERSDDVFYGSGKAETEGMSLPVIFGKMSNGEIVPRDLARLPHLLIGGQTGSGKSVFLHSLVCSLVQNRSPAHVRFVLMDPKRVEFGVYAKLPHLYSPIVHDAEQAVTMLKNLEVEMDKRLDFFSMKGCRSIADFYKANADARMPYIVVVIDELSDFIVGSDGAFESAACRIAAIGRSAGVHLVIATSRPDAKTVSGNLKANIPGRLAFRVCKKVDSLTLLDEYGAEELLGRGDALLKDCNGELVRLQVPYIRDVAITRIVESEIARYET